MAARSGVPKVKGRKRAGVLVAIERDAQRPPVGIWIPPQVWTPTTDARDERLWAPCKFCGAPVPSTVTTYEGSWRRHPGCEFAQPVERTVVAYAALGHRVSREDAALLPTPANYFEHAERVEPTWSPRPRRMPKPWGHARSRLLVALPHLPVLRVEAGLDVARCTDGGCAWCGVDEHREWFSEGHTFTDGAAAPLCGDCHQVYVRNGSPPPAFWDESRDALAEAATGVPTMLGHSAPVGLRAFAETTGRTVGGEPWAHLPPEPLRLLRFTAWARYGLRDCPPSRREEVQAWARQRDAQWAATAAERAAQEAKQANVFGF